MQEKLFRRINRRLIIALGALALLLTLSFFAAVYRTPNPRFPPRGAQWQPNMTYDIGGEQQLIFVGLPDSIVYAATDIVCPANAPAFSCQASVTDWRTKTQYLFLIKGARIKTVRESTGGIFLNLYPQNEATLYISQTPVG